MIDGYRYEVKRENKRTLYKFTDPDDLDNTAETEVTDAEMEDATFEHADLAYARVQQQLNEKRLERLERKTPLQLADEANEGIV